MKGYKKNIINYYFRFWRFFSFIPPLRDLPSISSVVSRGCNIIWPASICALTSGDAAFTVALVLKAQWERNQHVTTITKELI